MLGPILAAFLAPTAPAPAARPTTPPIPQAEQKEPLSVWAPGPGGGFEHLQTGLNCAAEAAGLRRTGLATFHPFGFDVGCAYGGEKAIVSLYLTRMNDPAAAFAGAKASLEAQNAERRPRLTSDGRASLGGLQWLRAEYAMDGGMRSEIWLADVHGWSLKYRVTYAADEAAAVAAGLEALTAQVRTTAVARLELCARSSAPTRSGKAIEGKAAAELGVAGAVLGGVTQGAAKGADPETLVYCVEEAIAETDKGFLSWRGVTGDGRDAQSDRLTALTMGPPPSLETSSDSLTGGRWIATMRDGDQTSIYAYFDGRPPPGALTGLLVRILDGKAAPLAAYRFEDGKITVSLPPSR